MKTKELIKLLQKKDPNGELECCVNNMDILFIHKQPAHYGGLLEVFERKDTEGFKIVGARKMSEGYKLQICGETISWLKKHNPEIIEI